jgi:hypothetical protein
VVGGGDRGVPADRPPQSAPLTVDGHLQLAQGSDPSAVADPRAPRVYGSEWVELWMDDVEVPGGQRFDHQRSTWISHALSGCRTFSGPDQAVGSQTRRSLLTGEMRETGAGPVTSTV